MTGRKSLFLFLMNLAWRCRYSMPLLLSGTVALVGRAWMFQIRVHTVHSLRESELALMHEQQFIDEEFENDDDDIDISTSDDEADDDDDDETWETESSGSWESVEEENNR